MSEIFLTNTACSINFPTGINEVISSSIYYKQIALKNWMLFFLQRMTPVSPEVFWL